LHDEAPAIRLAEEWRRTIMKSVAVVLAVLGAAMAAEAATIGNVEGRKTYSLDGPWRTIVDPYGFGYYDYRHEAKPDGFFMDAKPKSPSDRVEYDFDTSPTLEVPGDWNTQRESLLYYEGTLWYRTTFDDPRSGPATRLFVHFGAANYEARVWLNGRYLGSHEGGFTPFDFEVTQVLKPTGNSLVVLVDDTRRREQVPTLDTDWWNYGGITRSVDLVEVPETFVADYAVQLEKGSLDHVKGWVTLDGPKAAGATVTVRIPEAGVDQKAVTDAAGKAEISFAARLSLWSPESPKLYDVEVAGAGDTVTEPIGFRSVEVRGGDILLNGKPVFLRGVSAHEEAPMRSGRAWSAEDARTLLGWVKELHGNFVRLAHYPHNEHMTREADRMGILVWSEVPVYWVIAWDSEAALASARRQITENIARDKNRASVILWSAGNETPISDARNTFIRSLIALIRSLDPTRLVTAALERHYENPTTQLIDDPLGEDLDVVGVNEYVGWYDGLPEKCDGLQWKTRYAKPHVVSEFGAGARAGLHGRPDERWTEEYQESLYRHQVAMLKRIPFLRGTTPWILMDFRSPHRVLPFIQDGWNRKGLVSDRGQKKKAFFVLRDWYREIESAGR
jgi:beta-glucuronidase